MEDLPVSMRLVCREVKVSHERWLTVKEATANPCIKERGKGKGGEDAGQRGMHEVGWVCSMPGAKWQIFLGPE